MSRKGLLSLIGLAVFAVLFVPATSARFDLKVLDAATILSLGELGPRVVLSIDNGGNNPFPAIVHVELLKPQNESFGSTETEITLKSGRQKVGILLPLKTQDLVSKNERDILSYRLHYRVVPKGSPASSVEGFISLSEITPELFELRVVGPGAVSEGMLYQARVHAVHPITNGPAKGVRIKASATVYDDSTRKDTVVTNTAITDGEGYATVKLQLPQNIRADDFDLKVEGTRGLLVETVQREIDFSIQAGIALSTDKPIYQPGQTIHARVLMLGASKRALANRNVTLKIKDPEGAVAFNTELKTSRFGIASADWIIPESARLGTYSLEFGTDENHYSSSTVKVSRYELPNFVVNVKTDRPYYLPGQDATVTVRGDYLFGEPVRRGQVRVVRMTEQTWNSDKRQYETKEGDVFKGELGPDQTFTVRVPLSTDFKGLKDDDYKRFEDLTFTAFITDVSTNRTEQRRFDLRISNQAIHVYAMRPGDSYSESTGLPLTVYVSTFYPDGTPVRCNVVVTEGDSDDYEADEKPRVFARLKTNKYGVAKLSQSVAALIENSTSPTLTFSAEDKDGNRGTREEEFDFSEDEPGIRIKTAKTVFAPGEPILATVVTTEPSMTLSLDIVHEWTVIESRLIRVRDRRASVLLPYRPEFKDQITLAAHAERGEDSNLLATRTIIYPQRHDLTLKLQPETRTYRPGDEARVSFKALNAEGLSVESALGVVVVDKAVEERARTDSNGIRFASFFDDALLLSGHGTAFGAVSLKMLEKLDLTKPVPADLDLAAEIMLNRNAGYFPNRFGSDGYTKDHRSLFVPTIAAHLEPLRTVLGNLYDKTMTYPKDESSLRSVLSNNGIDFDSLKDPWGMPYRPSFVIQRHSDVLVLKSAGADKEFDTHDDITSAQLLWLYFRSTGEAIDKAVKRYHQRTGDFIRDYQTLREELIPLGVNLDTLKDRWLKPYAFRFYVQGSNHVVSVTTTDPTNYEFAVCESAIDYFAETRAKIDATLHERTRTSGFPQSHAEMRNALLPVGIDLDNLRDGWGNPYNITFNTISFYGDEVRMESHAVSNGEAKQVLKIKPVTSTVLSAKFRSMGPDAKEGTYDDFDLGTFAVTRYTKSVTDSQPKPTPILVTFSGATGAITGTVTDPAGAALPGATVTASAPGITNVFTATSNDDGRFLLRNLPEATYEIRVEAANFKQMVITSVRVQVATVFELNIVMEVAGVQEVVTVSGSAITDLPLQSSVSLSVSKVPSMPATRPKSVAPKHQQAFSTPRLREYFPETLVWQPELTTDKNGRAHLNFKLADNITTWKMSVIGSTETGEIGVAETEIKTFQPFFAELEPPQVLTQGDQISLPVVLRNYLPKTQAVDLELKPENWFSVNTSRKKTNVAARESATEFFDIQATSTITKGKQRVTALGSDFSDAIEKPVTVHPDGEEKSIAVSDLLNQSANLRFDLPSDTIGNSARVELKVYPNLMSHVFEGIEAVLQRPYGCGEQTISSTYPSLLVLRYLKQTKQEAPIAAKAHRYLSLGYKKLLGYQASSGGFTYWGNGDGDVALTAYAIRFLREAEDIMDVDSAVIERARDWLMTRQQANGSWPANAWWNAAENERQTGMLTALVARSLTDGTSCGAGERVATPEKTAITKTLDYLERRTKEIDEPYLLASYSLAASNACDSSRAANANNRLRSLAKKSSLGTSWSLETNTPFYSWGLPGQIETTALVVQALARERSSTTPAPQVTDELIDQGVLFLLRGKDPYGIWYSGQATVNVLNSLLAVISPAAQVNANDTVEVWVNARKINSVQMPANRRSDGPIMVDITSAIQTGNNSIELKRSAGSPAASAQIAGTYWIPWRTSPAADTNSDSRTLRLEAHCDKTALRVMEPVTCRVKAERVGFRGYGMLLAEIGLPPGADVDRSSLDTAVKSSNWAINQYDVLPDRIVVYLWPRGGGSEFEFKFRPRMPMNAQSSASVLYDYYNPEARVTVAPKRFVVK